MAVHGLVGEFLGVGESGPRSYIERLEFYFVANAVDDNAKQCAFLLSCCGASTYGLIRSLVAPRKPAEVSYEDIVRKVRVHYIPKPSQIVQRYKFNFRSQHLGESIADYVAELRWLSEHCGYGEQLQEMLHDHVVCGVADARCQQRLLAETDLSFDKAFKWQRPWSWPSGMCSNYIFGKLPAARPFRSCNFSREWVRRIHFHVIVAVVPMIKPVFTRLEEAGVCLKKEKCEFMLEEVEYFGHKISRDGLQPTQSKVAAVANAPEPTRVAELRSFFGLVNFYGKFLPDLATAAAPLHNLLLRTPLGGGERINNLPLRRSKP